MRKIDDDDIHGKITNHSVVVYGKDETGNYLINDPWKELGFHVIEPEHLLCAITAAQVECDNLILQLKTELNHRTSAIL